MPRCMRCSLREQRDPTARINLFGAGNDQALLRELIDVADVSRGKQIHRRAILDLAREQSGRAKHEHDLDLVRRFKLAPELFENVSQIRRRGDRNLLRLIICVAAGPAESERCQQRE